MSALICAIARNEGKYIRDFCEYHLGLGFDEIHIYDNGTEIPITHDDVVTHDLTKFDGKCPQMEAYRQMLKYDDYDWCAFIDIDEFITLNGYSNIHDLLEGLPSGTDAVAMEETIYGDSGQIIPEHPELPVYERLTIPSDYISCYKKFIINRASDITMPTPHHIKVNGGSVKPNIVDLYYGCHIRHYKTKTLSEFCDQKLNTPRVFNQTEKRKLSYYFRINEKTPEKIAYLKSRGIEIE